MAFYLIAAADRLLRRLALALLNGYQKTLGGLFAGRCRFSPTCSEYAKISFTRFSFLRALFLTLWRLARCHPFCPGGEDLPPPACGGAKGRDDAGE